MDHWRKGSVQLDDNVAALEADRVGDRVTVNFDRYQRAVDEANFDVFTTELPGHLLPGFRFCTLLDQTDNLFHFSDVERLVGLLARDADGGGCALNQLTSNTDNGGTDTDASLGFGLGQRFITVTHHTGDVGHGTGLHI